MTKQLRLPAVVEQEHQEARAKRRAAIREQVKATMKRRREAEQ